MLKTATAIGALALAFSTSAYAADVYNGGSTKDAPSQYHEGGSVVNWTGFYFQGQVGYGISQHDLTTTTTRIWDAAPSNCFKEFSGGNAKKSLIDDGGTPDPEDDVWEIASTAKGYSIVGLSEEECIAKYGPLGSEDVVKNGYHSLSYEGVETVGYDPAVEAGSATDVLKERTSDSGIEGGVRLGADYAMGRFLVGAFGEYNWSGIDGKENDWALGGRLGLIVVPRTLIYGLAAYTQAEYDFGGADTVTFDGWKLGAGVELALTGNVFLGAEYTHAMYDEETVFSGGGVTVEDELTEDKIMANIKIKLNGGF